MRRREHLRLLADEGLHGGVVQRMRNAGYSVKWIKEDAPGSLDPEILARPDIGDFILLTNDRDFSNLIFNKRSSQPFAVLYSRLPHRLAEETFRRFSTVLERGVAPGQMITITIDGVRTKPFPPGVQNG